ncbi:MAG TPA: PucR family transcriptional regulator ligand-binding domain-containing protein [Kineosporiaceae bacterium]
MAPTLAQLLAVPGLDLRVVAGAAGGSAALRRPITWVAVSELTDPTPYLEGGELVLLTGVGADLERGAAGYVGRLVAAGVSAVGFGIGVVLPAVPAALRAAADVAGLPLLEVDRRTPFIAVGKALADLIAFDQGERTRRRLDGMRSLTAQLAAGADPEAALGRLGGMVGGWAALLDGWARPVAQAGSGRRPDVATRLAAQLRARPGHASAAESDEHGRVTVLPLAARDRTRGPASAPAGYLAVGVAADVELDHQLVAFAASLFTLDAELARGARPLMRWARSAALARRARLPGPDPTAAVLGPLAGRGAVRVIAVRHPLPAVLDALPDEGGVSGLALDPEWSVLVVAEPDVDDVVGALPGTDRGISAPVADPADGAGLAGAVTQARSLGVRARGRPLYADQAAPQLLELLGPQVAASFAEGVLAPLRAAADGDLLRESLRAYLGAHGALAVAAARLGVHRHTLRARLRRAAALLGEDLDDVSTRATLWVALSALPADVPAGGQVPDHDCQGRI